MNFSGCSGNFPGGCYSDRQTVHYWGEEYVMSCWQWPSLDVRRSCQHLATCLWSAGWPEAEEAFCFPVRTRSEVITFKALFITYDKVQACSQLQGSCQATGVHNALERSTCPRYCLSTFPNNGRNGIMRVDWLALYFPTCISHIEIKQGSETTKLNKQSRIVSTSKVL